MNFTEYLSTFAVVGDSQATSITNALFVSPPVHNVYTMYYVYTDNLIEHLRTKVEVNGKVILLAGTNDVLLNKEESLETVLQNYFTYVRRIKNELGLKQLVVVTPPSISQDIEGPRSDFDKKALLERIRLVETFAKRYLESDPIVVIGSQIGVTPQGFIEDLYSHSDGVHLSEAGYNLLAEEIVKRLKEIDHG